MDEKLLESMWQKENNNNDKWEKLLRYSIYDDIQ